MAFRWLLPIVLLSLAGCVAPEEPEPPRYVAPAAPAPVDTTRYEAAPIPNAHVARPNDSVVKLGH